MDDLPRGLLIRLSSDDAHIIRMWVKSGEGRAGDQDLKEKSDEIIAAALAQASLKLKNDWSVGTFQFTLYKEGILIPEDILVDPPSDGEYFEIENL